MASDSSCPDSKTLRKLLAGGLTGRDETAIEGHLDECETCQETLESLTYDEEGMPREIACPDRSVLERMAYGSLGTYAWETVEHHLGTCKRCDADFNALASGEEPASRGGGCPALAVLERLAGGSLAAREQRDVEAHLQGCGACQARLDALAGGEGGWAHQFKSLKQEPESAGLKRVIGALKEESGLEAETSVEPAGPDHTVTLSFLDPPDVPGDLGKLGPYRVLELLGSGGMGIVLKAFDPALNRPVAIKVLAPQLATSSPARQRFAREARAAAAIRNEHVVAIHAVDEWKGLPFLVMEFIPGVSLQQRIDRSSAMDVNSILRIGMQAASGLAAAHAQGLVHRDVKPSNILLENGVERVKLTDFGLARAVDDASLTQSGVVAGTPLFMAPEQARSETIDHRADLFSLGTVLYAMCTGRSPFRASTTLGVLRRVCDDAHRPVPEVNPDIPAFLASIIDRLLAKEPASRFQSASEVAAVLNEHLARRQRGHGEDAEAKPGPSKVTAAAVEDVGPAKTPSRPRRWVRITAILIVILSSLFVIAQVAWETWNLPPIPELLGLRKAKGLLLIQWTNPELRITVNDQLLPQGPGAHYLFKETGGYSVRVFKGNAEAAHEFLNLKPGMSVELNVLDDGKIRYEYDGPIRTPGAELARDGTSRGSPLHDSRPPIWETRPSAPPAEVPAPTKSSPPGGDPPEEVRDRFSDELESAQALLREWKQNAAASKRQYGRALQLDKINAIDKTLFNQQKARFDADQAQVNKLQGLVLDARNRLLEAENALKSAEEEVRNNAGTPAGLPAGRGAPDRSQEELALVRADAAIKKAKARRDTRLEELERVKRLHERKSVSIGDLEEAEYNFAVADAEQHAAEAELAELQAFRKSNQPEPAPNDAATSREVAATRLARARALFAKAEATFRYRRAQLDRVTRLHANGSVSSLEVTEARGHLAEAEADLDVVRKELEQAEAKARPK